MAISFVGASAIWGLVYAYNNPGQAQTGLLNAIWVAARRRAADVAADLHAQAQLDPADGDPDLAAGRLRHGPAQLGDQGRAGGHHRGGPDRRRDASSRSSGEVVIPQIRGTIITVFVTVFITVLKVFDIVYVTTNGAYGTNVIAQPLLQQAVRASEAGQATAIVVVLLIAVIPLIWLPDQALPRRGGRGDEPHH